MIVTTENYFPNGLYQFIFPRLSFDSYHFLTPFKNYCSPVLKLANLMCESFSFFLLHIYLIIRRLVVFFVLNDFYCFLFIYIISLCCLSFLWFICLLYILQILIIWLYILQISSLSLWSLCLWYILKGMVLF